MKLIPALRVLMAMPRPTPPSWPDRFLNWYCNPELLEEIQGDAYELYERALRQRGKFSADLQFTWNVVRFCRWSNIKRSKKPTRPSAMMYKNYFKVFQRSFVKQKVYSFLNVFGLALGIACFLLISFYIRDEYSYDRFHTKADRIYRLHEIFESEGVGERSASLPFPVAEAVLNDHGNHIEKAVRLFNFQAPALSLATLDNEKEFNEPRVFFADSTFFDVFDFDLVEGDKRNALQHPDAIVITESMARKYFGDANPMGKYLRFQGNVNVLVTGVVKDLPSNVHFRFDFLISFSTLRHFYDEKTLGWYWNPCWTYFLMKDAGSVHAVQQAMPAFVKKYFPTFIVDDVRLGFIPLTDIHLKSHMDYEIEPNGSLSTLYIFGSVAIFVIVIACINFINLSTARAAKRAREVGMRKTLGSQKTQLIAQFLLESVTMCALSMGAAILIVLCALPFFNAFAEKNIPFAALTDPFYMTLIVTLPVVVGLLSGIYPAFVLASLQPITALKSSVNQDRGATFRKALVIVQFSLSIILLIGTGVSLDQLSMLQKDDTGFTRDNVLMIQVLRTPVAPVFEALRTEFKRNPNVLEVTAVEDILGAKHQVGNYTFEGMETSKPFPRLNVRHAFIEAFDIELVAGRNYSEDVNTDDSLALLVNEQLVRQMGWKSNEEAIGKTFGKRSDKRIVGVVKDFNFASRHQPIKPLVIDLNTNPAAFNLFLKYMAVRISPNDVPGTIAALKKTWERDFPGWPFDYFFLDSNLQNLYKAETKLSRVTFVFSVLSILVACLGLFGLSTYTAEQRKKEMSIRKVLGSTGGEIFMLFSKRFFVLILLANIIAFPLAYVLMNQWLAGFAYRVSIDPMLFLWVGLSVTAIALITICYQAWSASHTNPATVLKND